MFFYRIAQTAFTHEIGKTALRHKSKPDIGAVFEQLDFACGSKKRVVRSVLMLSVTVEEITDAKHQVSKGRALIVGVAVAARPRGKPERAGKTVEIDVCRGGKNAHAVIAVERAVIQRLRIRNLGAREECAVLLILHFGIFEQCLHICCLLRIVCPCCHTDGGHTAGKGEHCLTEENSEQQERCDGSASALAGKKEEIDEHQDKHEAA